MPLYPPAVASGANTALSNLSSVAVNTALIPASTDSAALGSTGKQWADLFLAEGGVINWDTGDATLTQVGDVVTLGGADLKVTSAGNVSTSVVTTDATQTLSAKTLTTPKVDTIAEETSANGVTVDGLSLKDGKLNTNDSVVTANITDANVTSAKLAQAFFRGRFLNTGSASTATGRTVEYGFDFAAGAAAATITKSISFPTAYSSVDNVIAVFNGTKAGSDPSGVTDGLGQASRVYISAYNVSTSGFDVVMRNNDSSNFTSGTRYAFSWQAVGTV